VHLELGHGVTPEEAEEVFAVQPLFRKTKKGHYVAMGPTQEGRYLVIAGWDMTKAEIRYWHKQKRK
jgi:hypothetical protein